MNEERIAHLGSHIDAITRDVVRIYGKWVDAEDVQQVMWVWALEHQDQAAKLPSWTLRRRLRDAAVAYARKEKATRSGYHPDDEHRYSQATILRLLADAFDPESTRPVTGLEGGAAKGEHVHMEWETQVADIRVGLAALGYADYRVLRQVAEGGRAANDLLAQDALRRLQRKINS